MFNVDLKKTLRKLKKCLKQGQKLVLSDALAVQSQGLLDLIGYQGLKVSSLKVVMGSKKMHWDLKNSFGISKNAFGSQKMY